jgi:hypothetical protein
MWVPVKDDPPKATPPKARRSLLVPVLLVGVGIGAGYILRDLVSPRSSSPLDVHARFELEEPSLADAPGSVPARGTSGVAPNPGVRPGSKSGSGSGPMAATAAADGGSAPGVAGANIEPEVQDTPTPKSKSSKRVEQLEDGWVFISGRATGGTSSISGSVSLAGPAPSLPQVHRQRYGCPEEPVPEPSLVVANGHLGNVLVHVLAIDGRTIFSAGSHLSSPPPPPPLLVKQEGCLFAPHVAVSGARAQVENTDTTEHCLQVVHAGSLVENVQLPPGAVADLPWGQGGGRSQLLSLECSNYPWMTGYVLETMSSFVAVTGPDGTFSFSGLPTGRSYTVEAWHERYGFQRSQVAVGDGPATVNFTFGDATEPQAQR